MSADLNSIFPKLIIFSDENTYTMTGGFDVERQSDNITSTIIESSTRFYMNVWPDFAGNSY